MIPIKIRNKKYKIKSIDELTTSEFLELVKIEELDLVKYISWQTGFKMKDAFFAVLSPAVEKAIGKVPDISQLKKPDIDYVDYDKKIETVGQRHQVEQSGKEGFELLAFTLAVSQARSNNIDDVNKLLDLYLTKPFTEILPAGFFFFRKLQPGKNFVQRNSARLLQLIRMRRQNSKRESIG